MKVTVNDVTFRVRGSTLIDSVSLVIPDGSLTAIIGPNGAGKSTLLHLLASDTSPSHGSVSYADVPAASIDVAQRARLRALLPQRHTAEVSFTVEQVVAMGRFPYRYDPQNSPLDDVAAVNEAIGVLGLTNVCDRPVRSLSGGEQQRVALARILAQRAPLVLLDEPTTALDIGHRASVMAVIEGLQPNGHTVVAVLHDLDLAAHFDHVVLLRDGSVAASGPPEAVLTSEALTDVYQHPIDVMANPSDAGILVLPRRLPPNGIV